jgi:hypothetical protein
MGEWCPCCDARLNWADEPVASEIAFKVLFGPLTRSHRARLAASKTLAALSNVISDICCGHPRMGLAMIGSLIKVDRGESAAPA